MLEIIETTKDKVLVYIPKELLSSIKNLLPPLTNAVTYSDNKGKTIAVQLWITKEVLNRINQTK
jgi:hypothetical protein